MLNDNKYHENKQIDAISPLVKKIMKFNSIYLMGNMAIIPIVIVFLFFRQQRFKRDLVILFMLLLW